MAKTLSMKYNVHLSKEFGGIKHGEKVGVLKKGTTVEIASDELAAHLIAEGNAEELAVDSRKGGK